MLGDDEEGDGELDGDEEGRTVAFDDGAASTSLVLLLLLTWFGSRNYRLRFSLVDDPSLSPHGKNLFSRHGLHHPHL